MVNNRTVTLPHKSNSLYTYNNKTAIQRDNLIIHNSVRKSKPLDIYVCAEYISKYVYPPYTRTVNRGQRIEQWICIRLLQFMWHYGHNCNIQESLFLQHTGGIVSSLQTPATTKSVLRLTTMIVQYRYTILMFYRFTYSLMYEKMGNFHICTIVSYYIISFSSKQLRRAHRTP